MGVTPGGQLQEACKQKEHHLRISLKGISSSYKDGKTLFCAEIFLLNFSVAPSHCTFWIQVLSLLYCFQNACLHNVCPQKTHLPLSPSQLLRHKYSCGKVEEWFFSVWFFKQQVGVLGTGEIPFHPHICSLGVYHSPKSHWCHLASCFQCPWDYGNYANGIKYSLLFVKC